MQNKIFIHKNHVKTRENIKQGCINKNSPSKHISNRSARAGVHSVAFMTLNIFRCDIVNWHQISQESLYEKCFIVLENSFFGNKCL